MSNSMEVPQEIKNRMTIWSLNPTSERESVSHSVVSDSLQPYAVHQSPLSMEFSRQEYWSSLPFPSPGDLPDPGIKPRSPALQADTLPSEPTGKLIVVISHQLKHDLFYTSLIWYIFHNVLNISLITKFTVTWKSIKFSFWIESWLF